MTREPSDHATMIRNTPAGEPIPASPTTALWAHRLALIKITVDEGAVNILDKDDIEWLVEYLDAEVNRPQGDKRQ